MSEKNYCGPDYFPEKVRGLLSDLFNEECKVHDSDYGNGTGKLVADAKFFYNMVIRCHQEKYPTWTYVVAFFFFFMVLIFGFFSYRRAKKK